MTFSDRTLAILALVSIVAASASLILTLVGARRRRSSLPGAPIKLDDTLRGILQGQAGQIKRLEEVVRKLNRTDHKQDGLIRGSVRHVSLLRYDAFEDVGGRLSFSCAMLDDHGTGVVLTSINGRAETRVYAKPVSELRSPYNLSSEEEEAIQQAMAAPQQTVGAS